MDPIEITYSLLDEGRRYTGHHRNYIIENARKICDAPETREKIRLNEALGYFGHGRRVLAGKMTLNEVETIKLPNGSSMVIENIPSNVTTSFDIDSDGNVTHGQRILESEPGRVVKGLHNSRVGGFSWACSGKDGGVSKPTLISTFDGFDYVMNPGFARNRGYVLESAADDVTREMVLESICQSAGVDDKTAEAYLASWRDAEVLRAASLESRMEEMAVMEAALRSDFDAHKAEYVKVKEQLKALEDANARRRKLIAESASKSIIVIPDAVQEILISGANEEDFAKLTAFFESAARMDLSGLPLGQAHDGVRIPVNGKRNRNDPPEFGSAEAGLMIFRGGPFGAR